MVNKAMLLVPNRKINNKSLIKHKARGLRIACKPCGSTSSLVGKPLKRPGILLDDRTQMGKPINRETGLVVT